MTFLECGGGWECKDVVSCPLGRAILSHAKIWVSICVSTESVSGELSTVGSGATQPSVAEHTPSNVLFLSELSLRS